MFSRAFLFSCLWGMSIPCVLLVMNEMSWQKIRGMMHVSLGQEASGVGIGVAPAGTVAAVTSGPSSGGNTPHTILVTVVSGASSIQVPLSGCSPCHSWNFFQQQAGGRLCVRQTLLAHRSWHSCRSCSRSWICFSLEQLLVFCVESTSLRTVCVN